MMVLRLDPARFVTTRDGQESEEWRIRALSTSADEKKSWALGVGFAVKDEVFYGSRTEQSLGSMINIIAAGIVTDPQVVKITGTTAHGKTVSVAPVNSCWCLVLPDIGMVDQWTKLEALDADGNVLHSIAVWNPSEQ